MHWIETNVLIQIKWLEKVQHIESAPRCIQGQSVTLRDGPLYISPCYMADHDHAYCVCITNFLVHVGHIIIDLN